MYDMILLKLRVPFMVFHSSHTNKASATYFTLNMHQYLVYTYTDLRDKADVKNKAEVRTAECWAMHLIQLLFFIFIIA